MWLAHFQPARPRVERRWRQSTTTLFGHRAECITAVIEDAATGDQADDEVIQVQWVFRVCPICRMLVCKRLADLLRTPASSQQHTEVCASQRLCRSEVGHRCLRLAPSRHVYLRNRIGTGQTMSSICRLCIEPRADAPALRSNTLSGI